MRKWICGIVLVLICLGVWWFISTNDERQSQAQYERFLKFANRQAVEIAIIRQSAELERLNLVQRPADPDDIPIK